MSFMKPVINVRGPLYFIPQLVYASAPVQQLSQEIKRALPRGGYEHQYADNVRDRLAAKHNLHMLHEKLDKTRDHQFQAYRGALSDIRVLDVWQALDYGASDSQKKAVLEDAILLSLGSKGRQATIPWRKLREKARGLNGSLLHGDIAEGSSMENSPKESLPTERKNGTNNIPTGEAPTSTNNPASLKLRRHYIEDGVSSKFCYRWPVQNNHDAPETTGQLNAWGTVSVKYKSSPSGTLLHLPPRPWESARSRVYCESPISAPPSSGFMLIMSNGKLLDLEKVSLVKAASAVGWIKFVDDPESVEQTTPQKPVMRQLRYDRAHEHAPRNSMIPEPAYERAPQNPVIQEPAHDRAPPEPVIPEPAYERAPPNPGIRAPAYGRAKKRASKGARLRFFGDREPLSKNSTNFRTHVAIDKRFGR